MPIIRRPTPPAPVRRVLKAPDQKAARRVGRARIVAKELDEKDLANSPFVGMLAKAAIVVNETAADAFIETYSSDEDKVGGPGIPIAPMYNFQVLAFLVQRSNILRQCIESYVINIESYGHTLEYVGPEGDEDKDEPQAEKKLIEAFLAACSSEKSLREIREHSRWDKETTGNRAFEVIRDRRGRIVFFEHVPSISLRKTRRDKEPTPVTIEVPNPADPNEMVRKKAERHFCRYLQLSRGGTKRTYYKEFGDPRTISARTGVVSEEPLDDEDEATEILWDDQYTPGHAYGLPRWIGQIPSILGSRESELVNLNFFQENAIPAMAVLISGGALTLESFDAIDDYIHALKGKKAMNRILVLEASADDTSGSVDGTAPAPKIDMKPMISERQQDGLFQDYDQKNQQKVRSSFRLPPIYTGRAEDYTRASAYASMLTAEGQIFMPERLAFDDIMNNKILRTYKPKYWRFKSLGPAVIDPESLGKMMEGFEKSGGMTPNVVIKIANKVLGVDIKPVTDAWGDYPFAVILEYVKQGREIKGMNEFLEALDPSTNTNDNGGQSGNTGDGKQVPLAAAKDTLRKELKSIADDIRESIVSSLQVPAT